MFQECFLTYYDVRCKNIENHFGMASLYFDPDSVHDLRVEIKQLRSYFSLIEWIVPNFEAKKYIRNIRKLFKSAADLRDVHVQQISTREWSREGGVFLSEYYNMLKHREFRARDHFAAFVKNFDVHAELELNKNRITQTLENFSDNEASAKTGERMEYLLRELIQHGNENRLEEEHLHKLRILSKETRYTLQVAQGCFPELGYHDTLDQQLRGLHQVLGKWHDLDIALEHIGEFLEEFQKQCADSYDSPPLTNIYVYEKLCQTLQEQKIDFLDTFEERWDMFIRFLQEN